MKLFKLFVFVPVKDAYKIRKVLADNDSGHIGNYDSCSFSVKGIGRFRPLEGAKPSIGEQGKIEEVEEERIEVIVTEDKLKKLLQAVIEAHPYEEPAIDIYPLANDEYLK